MFYGIVAISYAVIFTGAEFVGSPMSGMRGFMTLVLQWGMVSVAAAAVLGLISVSRWSFCIFYPLIIAISTIAAYFKLTMGASVTPAVIELATVNEMSTWLTLVSPLLVTVTILALAVSILVAVYRFRRVAAPRRPWIWLTIFAAVAVLPLSVQRLKAPVTARMPYSFYCSVMDWRNNRADIATARNTYQSTPAVCADTSLTVVFVIGESLRPDHLQLNGYERPTTPLLARDSSVVSLPDVHTDPYYTHTSVPRIMTRADAANPERATQEQSFITLFKRAGFRTAWLSNQDEVVSYAYFMHEADTLARVNAGRTLYDFGPQLDMDLLPSVNCFLQSDAPLKLAVVHSIGSHWWYGSHYTPEQARFKPEADSRVISELTTEQIVNSYDNTVVATDGFLDALINLLRNRNAVLIFVSDHGEALGEGGNYLHATDCAQLHKTAALVWYSPAYASAHPDKVKAMRANAGSPLTTDVMFHSVLDAATITTPALDAKMSIFRDERQ